MADEQFYTILTNVGKAKVANAALLSGNVTLKTLKVGDGNGAYYNPTEDQKDLKNTVYTCNVGSVSVDKDNPNWIVAETIIPGSVGGFTIREVGLFDTEGDMIAIGKYPETYKPVVANGASKDLNVRTIFEVSNAESVTLNLDPSVIIATKEDIENLQKQITSNDEDIAVLSNSNLLINGCFRICQRTSKDGTKVFKIGGIDGMNTYTVDRWRVQITAGSANVNQANKENGDFYLSVNSINVGEGDYIGVSQHLEQGLLKVGTYTVSLYYKSSCKLLFMLKNDTDLVGVAEKIIDSSDDFKKATLTFTITDSSKEYRFVINSNGNALANGEICFSDAKLELGDKATPFYPRSYGEELQLCRRYYRRMFSGPGGYGTFGVCQPGGGTIMYAIVNGDFGMMRIIPTFKYSGVFCLVYSNVEYDISGTISLNAFSSNNIKLELSNTSITDRTKIYEFRPKNDNDAYLEFDSEIY